MVIEKNELSALLWRLRQIKNTLNRIKWWCLWKQQRSELNRERWVTEAELLLFNVVMRELLFVCLNPQGVGFETHARILKRMYESMQHLLHLWKELWSAENLCLRSLRHWGFDKCSWVLNSEILSYSCLGLVTCAGLGKKSAPHSSVPCASHSSRDFGHYWDKEGLKVSIPELLINHSIPQQHARAWCSLPSQEDSCKYQTTTITAKAVMKNK